MQKFIEAMAADGLAPFDTADIVHTVGESRLIRGVTDKPGRKSLYYSLDDNFGHWYSCRTGEGGYWTPKIASKSLTPEERKQAKEERDRRIRELEDARIRMQSEVAVRLEGEWEFYSEKGDSAYLTKKGICNYEGRFDSEKLILKIVDRDWKIWGLQDIYPDGAKYLRKDARKKGCFIPIGVNDDSKPDEVYFCEGYATGCSIHEATEKPVIACIDAGNIEPVAVSLRVKWRDAKFIFCADNDDKREGGNIGIEKAQQAARKVGGYVIWPESVNDFNDLHVASGLDAVRTRLADVGLSPFPPTQQEGHPDEDLPHELPTFDPVEGVPALLGDFGLPLRTLGYGDEGYYYYYSFRKRAVCRLHSSQHTLNNLFFFCSLDEWRAWSGEHNASNIGLKASNALQTYATEVGPFSERDRIRGSGIWEDNGKVIINAGQHAYIDGKRADLHTIQTKNVYVASSDFLEPRDNPLTSSEAIKLKDICNSLSWANKLSGDLLAGWLVVAPVCTALEWRPHVWITGEAGSGKSTVLNTIIRPMLHRVANFYEGRTTEAAIRQSMNYDGRPIVFDEAEPGPSMDGVLALARSASSSEAPIVKFGQKNFKSQFCACFSSINNQLVKQADETRFSIMALRKTSGVNAQQQYEDLLRKIHETITPEYAAGMITRTTDNLSVLLQNIQTFKRAATNVLKDSRGAQQISAMLAGLYLLHSVKPIDYEDAEEWVAEKDWTTHTAIEAEPDHSRCLRRILSFIVRLQIGSKGVDASIGDLISEVYTGGDSTKYYDNYLRMRGFRVVKAREWKGDTVSGDGVFMLISSPHIENMLANTEWKNWSAALRNFKDVTVHKNVRYTTTSAGRSIHVPISVFYGKEDVVP